jgi:hypothetical protein
MRLRKAKIREALTTDVRYAVMKRHITALTAEEFTEAERYRREGRKLKMLQLHMETNL